MAFGIGDRLGVDVELKPLVHRLAALGTEGKGRCSSHRAQGVYRLVSAAS